MKRKENFQKSHKEDISLVEFLYLVFTPMTGES